MAPKFAIIPSVLRNNYVRKRRAIILKIIPVVLLLLPNTIITFLVFVYIYPSSVFFSMRNSVNAYFGSP